MDRDATLREIEQRVLWLATAIVAPRQPGAAQPGRAEGRRPPGVVSASMVTIMTALWFEHLRAEDRVSVKPHASPVLHAINYLLGELDAPYLTDAARVRRPAELPEPRSRTPTRSTTRPARSASARPRRSGARWPAATSTRQFGARRHRPAVLAGRRRRAGRGRGLGGVARPDGRRAGRGRLGRRPQPAVAGPGRARHRRRPAAGHVRRGRLAGAHRQVRAAARGAVRPARRRRAAAPGSTRCPTPSTSGCCAARRPSCASGCPATDPRPLRRAGRRASTTPTLRAADPQPRRPRPRRAAAQAFDADRRHPPDRDLRLHGQGLRPGHRGPPAEPLRAADRRPRWASSPAGSGIDPADPWAPLRRRQRRRPRCCARRPPSGCAATRPPPRRRPRVPGRPRPHPAGHRHHPGRAGPHPARPHPRRARRGGAGGHRQPGRQLVDQPGRLGQQGRRVVGPTSGATGSPTTPRRSCTGGSGPTGQHIELGIAETNLVGAARRARRHLEPVGPAAAARSACSTTRSSSARWSRGRSASTRAASRSWSARRPGSRSRPRAARTSRSPRRRSGWSSPAASTYEPAFAIDVEWMPARRAGPARAGPTAARPTCGCPPGRSTRRSPRCPTDPAARERRRRQVVAARYPLRRRRRRPAVTIAAMGARRARGARRGRPAGRARASPPTSSA